MSFSNDHIHTGNLKKLIKMRWPKSLNYLALTRALAGVVRRPPFH